MTQLETVTEYRDIKGFPGYRVGNDGSVWTAWKKKQIGYCKGTKSYISEHWRTLKAHPDKDGYLEVQLRRDGKYTHKRVHRLVLEMFVGPRPEHCTRHVTSTGKIATTRLEI